MKKTKLIIGLSYFLLLCNAKAMYPVFDNAVLLETITQVKQEMKNWSQKKILEEAKRRLMAKLSGMEIDAQNNAATNTIVREGRRAEELQKIKVTEMLMPDKDACNTIGTQLIEKASKNSVKKRINAFIDRDRKRTTGFDLSLGEWKSQQSAFVSEAANLCFAEDENGEQKGVSCLEKGNFITKDNLDAEGAKIADIKNKLLLGVVSPYKKSNSLSKNTSEKKQFQLLELRKELFKDLARVSLSEVSGQFKATNSLFSPYAILKKFDDERYGNAKWLKSIQNVDPENKNEVYISEVTRKIAVMDAFLVHLELIKYKQSLRKEQIQAAMLALMVDPV